MRHEVVDAINRLPERNRFVRGLRAWVGLPDGSTWASDELQGASAEPEALGCALAGRLRTVGAAEMLAQAAQMAAAT